MQINAQKIKQKYFEAVSNEIRSLLDPNTNEINEKYVETVPCPYCKKLDYRIILTKNYFNIVKCNSCSFVFTNPRIKYSKSLSYIKSSKSDDAWVEYLSCKSVADFNKSFYQQTIDSIIKTYIPNGNILDIGCSIGTFMKVAENSGYNCTGIELNRKASEYATKNGLNVISKNILDIEVKNKFDLVTLFEVLEHMPNPKEIFQKIYELTSDNKYILITVPNLFSFVGSILKEKSNAINGYSHLQYFNYKTLSRFVEENGFKIISYDTCIPALDQVEHQLKKSNGELFIPEKIFSNTTILSKLENLIIDMGMGYRLRLIAQKI